MRSAPTISAKDAVLALRYSRLSRVPTALYSAEILKEHGIPVVAFEYGMPVEPLRDVPGPIPRIRYAWPTSSWLPHKAFASLRLLRTYVHLHRLCQKMRPRLVIAHGFQEQVLAWLLFRSLGIPYVVHLHEVFEKGGVRGLNRLLFALEGPALRDASFVICSEATRAKVYRERYGFSQPALLAFNCPRKREPVPRVGVRERWGIPKDARLILYVGGLEDKNCILEAVRALVEVPSAHLAVVGWCGPEYRRKFEEEVIRNHVETRVHYLGEVEDKWELLDAADIGYCVYRPDELRTRHLATASNKLMESLAAGLPVLVSNNPDFRDFVENRQVGVSASELTERGIADAIKRMGKEDLDRWGKNGLDAHRKDLHYEFQYAPILARIQREFFPESLSLKSASNS